MLFRLKRKFLAVGVIWGLFSGIETLTPLNPLSWPKLVGEKLFSLLELTAIPPSAYYLAGVSIWGFLFWAIGELFERSILRRRVARSLNTYSSSGRSATPQYGGEELYQKDRTKQSGMEGGL